MPSRLVLLDNAVLTNFALVQRTDLVLELWGQADATTQAVIAEYQAGVIACDLAPNAWEDLMVLTLSTTERTVAEELSTALGAGGRGIFTRPLSDGPRGYDVAWVADAARLLNL